MSEKMKKVTLVFLFSACLLALMSCKKVSVRTGNTNDKGKVWRECVVSSFERVNVDAACNIEFIQSDTTRVLLKGRQRDIDRVKLWTENETLHVCHKAVSWKKDFGGYKPVKVYVYSPDLIGLTMESASNVDVKGLLDTDTLNIRMNGAGNLEFDKVVCDRLTLQLGGAGNADIDKLTAQSSDIILKGVGNIDVGFVNSGSARCSVLGVGNIELEGTLRRLYKKIYGAGHIDTGKLKVEEVL